MRIPEKIVCFSLSFCLATVSSFAQGNAAPHIQQTPHVQKTCRDFVQGFYNWYLKQTTKGRASDVALRYRKYAFSSELSQELKEDSRAQDKVVGELVGLDFDPFLNAQYIEDSYVVGKITPRGNRYWAEVYGVHDGKKTATPAVVPEVMLRDGHWIFVNFHYGKSKYPENENLLSILKVLRNERQPTTATDAATEVASAAKDDSAFRRQILNGTCCVPNLSTGYRAIKLTNGKCQIGDHDTSGEISIERIEFGQLDKKPVAVAIMSDWEGGSGIFRSLLLYELRGGRPVTVGSYVVGDRADVKSLSIKDGQVHMVREQTIGPDEGKQTTVALKRSQFDEAECLQEPPSKETQNDISQLMKIWQSISSDNKILTPEQKRQACAICNRHLQDRTTFANQFRLTLSAGGWCPGPHPLIFDKEGHPSLCVDDNVQNLHVTIELATPGM